MDIKRVQSITAWHCLQEIVRSYLEARPNNYYFLVMEHENKPTLCPSYGYTKQTNQRSKSISEPINEDHWHWLIWWSDNYSFLATGFYKFISKYSIQWNERRTNTETKNWGPLLVNYKILNYEFTSTIFCNGNGRKIFDWSPPRPDYKPTLPTEQNTDGFYSIATCDKDIPTQMFMETPMSFKGTKSPLSLPRNSKYSRLLTYYNTNV